MTRVLLIGGNDHAASQALALELRRQGHEVESASSGETGLAATESLKPEIVLLDLMLPDISELKVCRTIREQLQVPVIILTARSDEIDAAAGLEAGADDYIIKPASGEAVDACMRAVLRRRRFNDESD